VLFSTSERSICLYYLLCIFYFHASCISICKALAGNMDETPDERGIHQWNSINQFPEHLKK
jgi:hypothetical protein